MIQNQLKSLYTQGYDEIKIFYDNKSVLPQIIENINKNFISFQVLESNTKYCIVKSIAKEDGSNLAQVIRRIFFILLSFPETN